ncbi:hypothetical protein [Pseudoxanthomonas suwonensis]|uniref:Cyclase n=1 Tax=Pseudoxanthomonas suwonensis TaxID=314722 RepID=A0A0E3YYY1_9GAMM|nr:hypothetical protein [Pseudoxanthomonas suwonensis]AKC85639.1 cyclase [Pseudoxanthomonas suwonensis]
MDPTAQHRVVFDFEIGFGNGGDLRGRDFRLDIEGRDIDDAALARRLVDDLRLLMVETVRVRNKRIVAEPHKRPAAAAHEGELRQ